MLRQMKNYDNFRIGYMSKRDPEEIRELWLQQYQKVCICKGIPRKNFIKAIRAGAQTVEAVDRIVGSGGGDCNGERCGPKIIELIHEYREDTKI